MWCQGVLRSRGSTLQPSPHLLVSLPLCMYSKGSPQLHVYQAPMAAAVEG